MLIIYLRKKAGEIYPIIKRRQYLEGEEKKAEIKGRRTALPFTVSVSSISSHYTPASLQNRPLRAGPYLG